MAKHIDEELAAKRQTAAYLYKRDQLRRSEPDMPEAEADRLGIEANDLAVFGSDAKKDRRGNYLQQGFGAPGHETSNHFASIRRWQGEASWREAVVEIWKRDPDRAARLGLPKLSSEKVS